MRVTFSYNGVQRTGSIIDTKSGLPTPESSASSLLFLVQCDHKSHPQWFHSDRMVMMRSVEFDNAIGNGAWRNAVSA